MADQDSFPVGQAPWEQSGSNDPHPDSFPVGQAPWESADNSPGVIASLAKAYDSYLGAPTRAAVYAAQGGNNPFPAFGKQFGADPSQAPTEADIGAKMGLSRDRPTLSADQQRQFDEQHNPNRVAITDYQDQSIPSKAEAAGKLITTAADPLNAIPVVDELGLGAKIAGGLGKAADVAGDTLKGAAEGAAVNATGATASQAAKFGEDAGREILDRGVVKFGDSQAKIAKRAAEQMEEANGQISSALKGLQDKGVTVKAADIESALNQRIDALKIDPSNADIVKRLQGEVENLKNTGKPEFGISDAENIKRGYNRKAGNWADPESAMAGKETYQAWRGAVEDAATKADPDVAKQFTKAKESYGVLAPIQEASQRRALVQHQAPVGDFKDLMTGELAEHIGGPVVGGAAMVGRHVIVPRLASSAAVALDKAGNAVKALPGAAGAVTKAIPAAGAGAALSGSPAAVLPAAAEVPAKGSAKWANDGAQNLIAHGADKALIAKAQSDPKMQTLLIKASDLRPGTKAMDNLLAQVKSAQGGG